MPLSPRLRGGCKRRCKQEDAEVGVAAGGGERRLDRVADARADFQVAIGDPRRGGRGGFLEVRGLHAVAAGMDVHVAGFERGELGAAGGEEKIARLGLAQAGHRRARWWSATAARKSSTIASATSTSETLCSPRQEGLLLTSSTMSRPSGAAMRSTPA